MLHPFAVSFGFCFVYWYFLFCFYLKITYALHRTSQMDYTPIILCQSPCFSLGYGELEGVMIFSVVYIKGLGEV